MARWWSAAASDEDIELVVDLSNVCYDTGLGDSRRTAQLARIDLLAEAWDSWESGFEDPAVRLVADDVLRSDFTSDERRRLKDLETDGWVELAPKADPVILDHAERSAAMVISNDQYVAHRREHPWIENSARQFVGWTTRAGLPLLRPSLIHSHTDYSVSRAVESDEIKALRLNSTGGKATLEGVYRCENQQCLRQRLSPPGAETPPNRRVSADRPTCLGCGEPLTLVGRRTDTAVIKLEGDAGVERVPLPEGSAVVIGRASPDLKLKSIVTDSALGHLSRLHLEVALTDGSVRVTDLGSSAGSTLERWDRARRSHAAASDLKPHQTIVLQPRDRVVAAGVLTIERSGRRYPFDLAPVGARAN